jgi:hypothetical protein
MKIRRNLSLIGSTYCVPVTKTCKDTHARWALCNSFVQELLGSTPVKIRVTVTDELSKAVLLNQQGYSLIVLTNNFHWNWASPYLQQKSMMMGMFSHAGNAVKRLMGKRQFPFLLYVKVEEIS